MHLDYLDIAFLSSRLRERTVAVGWSAGLLHGLWHEPAGRWIGAPCSRFLLVGVLDYQGPRLLSANLQVKWGRGRWREGRGVHWGVGAAPMNP